MVHGENRIPYWIDRRLTGLAGPDYDATISFGLPIEPEDSEYGESRFRGFAERPWPEWVGHATERWVSCCHHCRSGGGTRLRAIK